MTLAVKPAWLTGGPLGASFSLLRAAYDAFNADKASRLGAALAYFSLFSIAPLIIILSSIAGLVFGEAIARAHLFSLLRTLMGPSSAETIRFLAANSFRGGGGLWGTILGSVLLLLGAAGAFLQLKDAFDTVWGVRIETRGSLWTAIELQIMAVVSLLVTGGIFTGIILLSTALTLLERFVGTPPGGNLAWQSLNFLFSFTLLTLLFALMYEWIPSGKPAWREAWSGGAFTSALFSVGMILLGIYFGRSNLASVYGASSSLVILLLWVFYSAQILLFGAEFTKVLALRNGRPIRSETSPPEAKSLPAALSPSLPCREKQKNPTLWASFALCFLLFCFFCFFCFLNSLKKSPLFRGGREAS